METIIHAKNLYKSFGDLNVLKGIDLSIKKGEIVAIVGPSGAGKTTLLQLLGTLSKPDVNLATEFRIQGQDMLTLNAKQLAAFRNQSLGFIFQFHELLPEFTALENVLMPGLIQGKKKTALLARGKELLEHLGVAHRANNSPTTLSGGEQQRVAVARALLNAPELIFADEPSGNLDSKNAEELHRLFFSLREELNQTFIIVTHNSELARMADRTIQLVDGKIVS